MLEGLPPLADEPGGGEEDRLVERIGELVAQRRRVDALRHGGALTSGAAADLEARSTGGSPPLAERLGVRAAGARSLLKTAAAGPSAGASGSAVEASPRAPRDRASRSARTPP